MSTRPNDGGDPTPLVIVFLFLYGLAVAAWFFCDVFLLGRGAR